MTKEMARLAEGKPSEVEIAIKEFTQTVLEMDIVKEVKTEGQTITVTVDCPPFESELIKSIYQAEVDLYSKYPSTHGVHIRVHNIQEE